MSIFGLHVHQHIHVDAGTSGMYENAMRVCTDGPHTSPPSQKGHALWASPANHEHSLSLLHAR